MSSSTALEENAVAVVVAEAAAEAAVGIVQEGNTLFQEGHTLGMGNTVWWDIDTW